MRVDLWGLGFAKKRNLNPQLRPRCPGRGRRPFEFLVPTVGGGARPSRSYSGQ
jgi:hypothetical protein